MQNKTSINASSKRAAVEIQTHFSGLLCLSPAMQEALQKMKRWIGINENHNTTLGSQELKTASAEMFQPLFQNDYAPPVVAKEIASLVVPSELNLEPTAKPDVFRLQWQRMEGRHLFLVQINDENPERAASWITNCVCTQSSLEIESIDTDKPFWVRVCVLRNDGRSAWARTEWRGVLNSK